MSVDLHLHLDGSLTPQTALELIKLEKIDFPKGSIPDLIQVGPDCSDLMEYLSKFDLTVTLLQTAQSLKLAANRAATDSLINGCTYIEVRFAPALHMQKGLDLDAVIGNVWAGLQKAELDSRGSIKCRMIIICMRNHSYATNVEVIRAARRHYGRGGVVAVDMAGDERYDFMQYKPLFGLADRLGMPITIHAGEAAGPENIRIAVEVLGASRIGHGVRLKDDPNVFRLIKNKGIPLELCPSSNIQTKAVPDWDSYPIKEYLDAGIKVTVHTDNPGVSNTNIKKEYSLLREKVGLSEADIAQIKQNSADVAFDL